VITHFEATVTLLAAVIGMLATLIGSVWKARGWIDRLNETDSKLAAAIENLAVTQRDLHSENRARFEAIERRLEPPRRRGRGDAGAGAPAR
jgi:hypothetical protein